MNNRLRTAALSLAALCLSASAEQSSRVVSAGLFKNGLASITREYTVPGPGMYTFDALGTPVHGTLTITGADGVVARTSLEEAELTPEEAVGAGIHETLVGKHVSIGLRLEGSMPFDGRLISAPGGPSAIQEPTARSAYRSAVIPPASEMYVLESKDGRLVYLAADQVISVEGMEAAGAMKRKKPVLTLEVPVGAATPSTIRVAYLASGLSWAPGYQLDLSDPATLSIVQSAVIRNDLEPLDNVALSLISGFPNVEFSQVTSPFAAGASWPDFFAALNRSPEEVAQMGVMYQSMIASNAVGFGGGGFGGQGMSTSAAADDGADVHYQPVGARSLGVNETLFLQVASASAAYDSVVVWNLPDTRGVQGYSMPQPGAPPESLWDAVRFKNPFPFPMTTAPAAVQKNGQFLGSKASEWANPGDEALVYVSKALSVIAKSEEKEAQERPNVSTGGFSAMQSTITGTLNLHNLRAEAAELIIHKGLSGEFVESSAEPEIQVGVGGAGQFNPSLKLTWRLRLEPGEEKALTYTYRFLVR